MSGPQPLSASPRLILSATLRTAAPRFQRAKPSRFEIMTSLPVEVGDTPPLLNLLFHVKRCGSKVTWRLMVTSEHADRPRWLHHGIACGGPYESGFRRVLPEQSQKRPPSLGTHASRATHQRHDTDDRSVAYPLSSFAHALITSPTVELIISMGPCPWTIHNGTFRLLEPALTGSGSRWVPRLTVLNKVNPVGGLQWTGATEIGGHH